MTYDFPYDIFNQQAIMEYQHRQQMVHLEQEINITRMVKAISDYCDAARRISPEYQQEATRRVIAEIVHRMSE